MTNREAIEFLSQIRDALLASNSWLPSTDNPIKESFGMAINALTTQEQLAKNSPKLDSDSGDLISRAAAIDAVQHAFDKETILFRFVRKVAIDALQVMPSAQPDLPIKEKCAFCPHCNNCDVNDDLSIQPCVDTISRQKAINTVHEMRKKCDTDNIDDYEEMLTVALEELCSAQPDLEELDFVQPHPKTSVTLEILSQPQRTGRWIQYGDEFCCSECGGWAYMDECDEGIKTHQSKFCPECGARMEDNNESD